MWRSSICLIFALTGCQQMMAHQPYYRPMSSSDFFPRGMSALRPVPDTVPRGHVYHGSTYETGLLKGKPVKAFPYPVTLQMLKRGQARYNIYCSPCHDLSGDGNGMIVQRGFPHPPVLTSSDLRRSSVGHFVDVINRGHGVMYSYADRVSPSDRWAIAAYIRALQLSQYASISDVPEPERHKLLEQKP